MEDNKYIKVDFIKPTEKEGIVLPSVKILTEKEMAFDRILEIKHRLDKACIYTESLAIKVTPREYYLLSEHRYHVQGRVMGEVCGISIVVGDTK